MGLRPRSLLALGSLTLAGTVALAGAAVAGSRTPPTKRSGTTSTSSTTTTSPGGSTTTTVPSGPIKLKKGGTVVVAVPSLPTQFNPSTPAGSNAATAMVTAQIWPSPFVVGPNNAELPSVELDSAELVGVKPETVVYTINKAAVWSDGVPISAADFIEQWHEELAVGAQLPANTPVAGYRDIASMKSSSKGKVVTVVFTKPYADWEALFSGLMPAHVVARYGWESAFAGADPAHLVSGGPYEVTAVVPGKEVVLGRNPHYWGQSPTLDRIVFLVVHGASKIIAGLQHGQIQVAALAPSRTLDEAIWGVNTLGDEVVQSPMQWQLDFNLNDPTLSSLVLRQALVEAISRTELAADSVDFENGNNPLSGNRLFTIGAPGSQGNAGGYPAVDDTLSAKVLALAGYRLGPDGLVHRSDGTALVLQLVGPTGSLLVRQVEQQLQAQFQDVGVTLQVKNVPAGELLSSTLPSGAYQLALAPYLLSPYPAENASFYESPVAPVASTPFEAKSSSSGVETATLLKPLAPGSGTEPSAVQAGTVTRDVTGYQDPAVSALFDQAEQQLNPLSMESLYNQADSQLWLDLPTLPLFQVPVELVKSNLLVNVHESSTLAGPLYNAQNWAIQLPPPPTTTTTTSTTTSTTLAKKG
ncbi:MAG: extracellular solute-binding protein family 5 [Acidimicrobiaceae bacterium]|nr:extracellular solute-binding protein family 5 [Acidimicrobiaceae bacterium]